MYQRLRQYIQYPPSQVIGLSYACLSLLYGSLFARFPDFLNTIQVNNAQFGLSLLSMSIGALIFTPVTNYLLHLLRTGSCLLIGMILMSLTFVFPILTSSFTGLLIAMFLLGASTAWINVAVNAAAANVEKQTQRPILSMSHAMYSIGGVIGATSAGLLAKWGVPFLYHLIGLAIIVIFVQLSKRSTILQLPHAVREKSASWKRPGWEISKLAGIAFFIVMAEVAVMDWSAVYLNNDLQSSALVTGLGFAGYSLSMALGRLSGDWIISTIGARQLVWFGIILGVIGLALTAFVHQLFFAVAGFTLVGLGFSCVVPTVYSASGKLKNIHPSAGVTIIATAGIIGILIGRPLIGFIAESRGLHNGFALLSLFALIAAGIAYWTNFGQEPEK